MTKLMAIFGVLVTGFAATSANAQLPLSFLHGDWEGQGTTSGLAASIRHTWQSALNGQFTTLHLSNRMVGNDGQVFEFAGVGYYKVAAEDTVSGVWVDTQGLIRPLRGSLDNLTLTIIWGTEETELGRSVYRVSSADELEAVNSVRNESGDWQEFGRAVLKRQ